MKLEITKKENCIEAKLIGRLDTLASSQFAIDMEPLLDTANEHIVLDCSALEFISSSGLRLLLMLRKKSIAMGGEVSISGVSEQVKQVFTITGFYSLFNFI